MAVHEANDISHLSTRGKGTFRTTCISAACISEVEQSLKAQGFRINSLDSVRIFDKETLFVELVKCFDLLDVTKCGGQPSWDGTSDFIYQALMERPDKRVALLWSGVDNLLKSHFQLILDTLEVLNSLVVTSKANSWCSSGGSAVCFIWRGAEFSKMVLSQSRKLNLRS
jgi:hypothetical protein